MPYQLPPDLETELNLRVSTGNYPNVEHVLREALTALDSRDREIAAIQEGIDAMERGELMPLDQFDREFRVTHNMPLDA